MIAIAKDLLVFPSKSSNGRLILRICKLDINSTGLESDSPFVNTNLRLGGCGNDGQAKTQTLIAIRRSGGSLVLSS
jgi:hypothetical protein